MRLLARAVPFAIVLLAAGCARPAGQKVDEAPIPVTVVTPGERSATAEQATYPVNIARDRETSLGFRIGGIMASSPPRIGERVAAGSAIARLDATSVRAARVRAEEDAGRAARAAARARELAPAGAIAGSAEEDARSAATAARAALDSARYDERSAQLRAPFSGVVLARSAELGQTVAPGQEILRVADLASALLARAAVPPEVAARLRPGAPALVAVAAHSAIPARVRRIAASADPRTGTVEVQLVLPREASLPSGATGSVRFASAAQAGSGMSLPAEALLDAHGNAGHVFVVDPRSNVARRVEVRIAGFGGEALSVTGLAPQALVITNGAGFVRDGQRVAPARP